MPELMLFDPRKEKTVKVGSVEDGCFIKEVKDKQDKVDNSVLEGLSFL